MNSSPTGRVIRMIEWVWEQNQNAYNDLDDAQRRQVFVIPFEDFVQRPHGHLSPLTDYIGSAITKNTASVLRQQRCQRKLPNETRKSSSEIKAKISREEMVIFDRLVEEYEDLAQRFAR